MNTFGYIMLVGWLPLTIVLFVMVSPRRAVLIAYFGSWLLLPVVAINFHGLPPFDKTAVAGYGILLGILFFDSGALTRFRLRWFDWPMIIWCVCPIFSSLSNNLGIYNGLSAMWMQIVTFGVPYFVGRLYFYDFDSLRDLTVALFISGLIYTPFCLYEMRMSPQLHRIFYGVQLQSFIHSRRFGGWRPIVFIYGGSDLALWMVSASLAGLVLWRTRIIRYIHGIPMILFCGVLWSTTVLTRSMSSLTLGVAAAGIFFFVRAFSARWLLMVLLIAIPVYLTVKVAVNWRGTVLIESAQMVSDARAQSLQFRFEKEYAMIKKAMKQPWFGWGGYGRARVYSKYGKDLSVTDSLMIIALGQHGLIALSALFAALLLPLAILIWRMPPGMWRLESTAIVLMLGLLLWIDATDKLINPLVAPMFGLVGGGIVTLAANLITHRTPVVQKPISTSPASQA